MLTPNASRARLPHWLQRRLQSSWLTAESAKASKANIDVEQLFINRDVQSLLYKLTGLDLHGKVFRERNIRKQQRPHYALMTNKMFDEAVRKMETRGRKFLQFVPVKEARANTSEVLSRDADIAGFDQSKYVFTDITFDVTNRERLVVVRETDGSLRTTVPEERDRMNRVYYEQPDRPVKPPALFESEHLDEALEAKKHEFVLDWACYFYEPDDAMFVQISRRVFDSILKTGDYHLLHSTRHFGPLIFYLVLNRHMKPLLRYFASSASLTNVANLIRLYHNVFPDWRRGSVASVPDRRIVDSFLKTNPELKTSHIEQLLRGYQ